MTRGKLLSAGVGGRILGGFCNTSETKEGPAAALVTILRVSKLVGQDYELPASLRSEPLRR